MHARKIRWNFNTREYFCFKGGISCFLVWAEAAAAQQFYTVENCEIHLKHVLKKYNTAIRGPIYSIRTLMDQRGLMSGLRKLLPVQPSICNLKHCDETNGWFEMIRGYTENNRGFESLLRQMLDSIF